MLPYCNKCGAKMTTQSSSCPGCAANSPKLSTTVRKAAILSIGLFAVLMVGILGFSETPDPVKRQASLKIERCWKDWERKSLNAETKLTLASWCEQFERDFERNYGHKP